MWAAFILTICLMPGRHVPKVTIPHFDKIVHTSIYLIFAVLTYYGWTRQQSIETLHKRTLLKLIITMAAYGMMVEIMQETFTTDRHFELIDELANTSGGIIGALLANTFLAGTKA